jgi:excisionase family DNA binding protein
MPKTIPLGSTPHLATDESELYIDKKELAAILNVSQRTIESWVWRRKIPYIALSRRCVRFKLRDVMRSLESQYSVRASQLETRTKGGAS